MFQFWTDFRVTFSCVLIASHFFLYMVLVSLAWSLKLSNCQNVKLTSNKKNYPQKAQPYWGWLRPATLLKKRLRNRCFVNVANFLRTPFLQSTSGSCFYFYFTFNVIQVQVGPSFQWNSLVKSSNDESSDDEEDDGIS